MFCLDKLFWKAKCLPIPQCRGVVKKLLGTNNTIGGLIKPSIYIDCVLCLVSGERTDNLFFHTLFLLRFCSGFRYVDQKGKISEERIIANVFLEKASLPLF